MPARSWSSNAIWVASSISSRRSTGPSRPCDIASRASQTQPGSPWLPTTDVGRRAGGPLTILGVGPASDGGDGVADGAGTGRAPRARRLTRRRGWWRWHGLQGRAERHDLETDARFGPGPNAFRAPVIAAGGSLRLPLLRAGVVIWPVIAAWS